MSREDLETFRGLVLGDEQLQERLRRTDRAGFATEIVALAAERRLDVARENVEDAVRERRTAWRRAWV